MWDYDKLFAEGNIIGISPTKNEVINLVCSKFNHNIDGFRNLYSNNDLSYENIKIQYIIRLDEHGNVIEKLFDREKDMPNFMPKLKTGMFVKVLSNMGNNNVTYGYVDKENNRIILQNGEWFQLNKLLYDIEHFNPLVEIIAIYDNVVSFNHCLKSEPIWHK